VGEVGSPVRAAAVAAAAAELAPAPPAAAAAPRRAVRRRTSGVEFSDAARADAGGGAGAAADAAAATSAHATTPAVHRVPEPAPAASPPAVARTDTHAPASPPAALASPPAAPAPLAGDAAASPSSPAPPAGPVFVELFPTRPQAASTSGPTGGHTLHAVQRVRQRLAIASSAGIDASEGVFDVDALAAAPVRGSNHDARARHDTARLRALAFGVDPSQQPGGTGSGAGDVAHSMLADGAGVLHDATHAHVGSRVGHTAGAGVDANRVALARLRARERIEKARLARGVRERFFRDQARGRETGDELGVRALSADRATRDADGGARGAARAGSQPPPSARGRIGALGADDDHEADVIAAAAESAVSASLDSGEAEGVKRVVGALSSTTPRRWAAVAAESRDAIQSALAHNRAAFDKVLARRMALEAEAVTRANATRALLRGLCMDERGDPVDPRSLMTVEELRADDDAIEAKRLEAERNASRTVTGFRRDKLAIAIKTATATIYDYDMSVRAIDAFDQLLSGGVLYAAHQAKVELLEKQRRAVAAKLGLEWDAAKGAVAGAVESKARTAAEELAAARALAATATGDDFEFRRAAALADAAAARAKGAQDAADAAAAVPVIDRPGSHALDAMFASARAALAARRAQHEMTADTVVNSALAALAAGGAPLRSGGALLTAAAAAAAAATEPHPVLAALTFTGSLSGGVEGNHFALARDARGIYSQARDPARFRSLDPYLFDTAVQGAPVSGIRRLQPRFGEGLTHGLFKGNPYAGGHVVRGSTWFDPETADQKAARPVGEKPPAFVRLSLPAPNEFTGISLEATVRGREPAAAESLAERRALHEKRLVRAEEEVRRFRAVGGVRFIDNDDDEKAYAAEKDAAAAAAALAADAAGRDGPLAKLEAFAASAASGAPRGARAHAAQERERGAAAASAAAAAAASTRDAAALIAPRRADEEADDAVDVGADEGGGDVDDGADDGGSAGGGAGGDAAAAAAAEERDAAGRVVAVVRRTNPFGTLRDGAHVLAQTAEATAQVLVDPNDRSYVSAHSRWKAATLMRGYTSGNVADFLRLQAIFAPFAEAEWMVRGGAYLERRAAAVDFVRAVRRRMQSRDPLTGLPLDALLGGAPPRVPGQPSPLDPDHVERWDGMLVPSVCRYFATCMRDGVPPLFGEISPAAAAARAAMTALVRRHRADAAPRTLRAVREQWDAYCALFKVDPLDIKRRADDKEELWQQKQDRNKQTMGTLILRAAARKKKLMAERRAAIVARHSAEAAALAEEVRKKGEALERARRERAVAMGLNPDATGARAAEAARAAARVAANNDIGY
jgi:hypothetical protein